MHRKIKSYQIYDLHGNIIHGELSQTLTTSRRKRKAAYRSIKPRIKRYLARLVDHSTQATLSISRRILDEIQPIIAKFGRDIAITNSNGEMKENCIFPFLSNLNIPETSLLTKLFSKIVQQSPIQTPRQRMTPPCQTILKHPRATYSYL